MWYLCWTMNISSRVLVLKNTMNVQNCSINAAVEKKFGHINPSRASCEEGDLIGWSEDDDSSNSNYVNLRLNPERFTGYR